MIPALLVFWVISAIFLIWERRVVRLIILLGIYSLITTVCFFLLAAPDVAMAEAVVSAFSTILFIVCFEKYYSMVAPARPKEVKRKKDRKLIPLCFTVLLAALFIWGISDLPPVTYLKDRYIELFASEIGGENAVTAIYLGYRMYDTVYETLMLLVSIVAVAHLSRYEDMAVTKEVPSGASSSSIAGVTIRVICPILLLVSIYLVANGHISPGGGFHGGVVAAAFFVCRYMVYGITDMRVEKAIVMEKIVYLVIISFVVYFIVLGAHSYLPIPKTIYLTIVNLLLGIKVACGFFIVFYRFIAFERRVDQ